MNFDIREKGIEQKIISDKNPWFNHFVKNQRSYFLLLALILLMIPLLSNYIHGKPIIMGEESYYHLSQIDQIGLKNFYYYPLKLVLDILPNTWWFVIPIFLAMASIILFIEIIRKTTISRNVVFFFLLIFIISPTFIYTYTTLSAYSFYLFLILLGFFTLSQENKKIRQLAIIPFLLATLFDLYSSVFLIVILMGYFYLARTEKSGYNHLLIGLTTLTSLFNYFVLKIPFVLGPFHLEQKIPDLISDLGGLSGINFFTLIIAFFGLATTWKRKNFYIFYLFIPLVIVGYLYNTQTIFHLTLMTVFFASTGFIKIFQRNWDLAALKKLTFFLLLLGLVFSTLTYVERIQDYGPTFSDAETLLWVKNNAQVDGKILSVPENSYYISYYSKNNPLFNLKDKKSINITKTALTSLYIGELFPILEENNVSIIYINKKVKEQLSEEQGFLFLLKNERFKIIHSHKDSEVWLFIKEE
jgi:hypothetical protein